MGINDRWKGLPDIVQQLKDEATAPPVKLRNASERTAAEESLLERLTSDDDRTILRVSHAAPAPGSSAAATAQTVDIAPAPERDDEDFVTTTWPGLTDYDELLADAAPDPRPLLARLRGEADRVLGERARMLHPLFDDLGRRLEALLAPPLDISGERPAQAKAVLESLDKIEDLFAALMVMR
jgi:hypothetical protein